MVMASLNPKNLRFLSLPQKFLQHEKNRMNKIISVVQLFTLVYTVHDFIHMREALWWYLRKIQKKYENSKFQLQNSNTRKKH